MNPIIDKPPEKPFLALLGIFMVIGLVLVYSAWRGSALIGVWEGVSEERANERQAIVLSADRIHISHMLYEFNRDGTMRIGFQGAGFSDTYIHWYIFGPMLVIVYGSEHSIYRYRFYDDRLFLKYIGPERRLISSSLRPGTILEFLRVTD